MASNQGKINDVEACPPSINKPTKTLITSQIILRSVAAVSALSATLLMLRNKQSISLFGLQIVAKYTQSSAFRFFVGANAVASAYALVALGLYLFMNYSQSKRRGHFIVFLFDLMMVCLVMAGSSAATAIAYVAKNGEKHTGWVPIWDNLHTFCKRAGPSMFAPSPLSLPSFSSLCSLPLD